CIDSTTRTASREPTCPIAATATRGAVGRNSYRLARRLPRRRFAFVSGLARLAFTPPEGLPSVTGRRADLLLRVGVPTSLPPEPGVLAPLGLTPATARTGAALASASARAICSRVLTTRLRPVPLRAMRAAMPLLFVPAWATRRRRVQVPRWPAMIRRTSAMPTLWPH